METIFVLLPLALLIAAIAVGFFIWAARTGQFDDLETPAVRMLFDDEEPRRPRWRAPGTGARFDSLRRRQPIRQGGFPNERQEHARLHPRGGDHRDRDGLPRATRSATRARATSRASRSLFSHTRMAGPPVWQADANGQQVNVGGFGIPCVYCHTMPYKGRHSTLPSTAVCMNCHTTVGPEQGVGPEDEGVLGPRRADSVGEGARPARLRLLRPLGAPEREGRERATRSCR